MQGKALRTYSRRYSHERTGEPMPAYVISGYVAERARRDWDARAAGLRGSAGNPQHREWWEVRQQGTRMYPGCSVGPLLFDALTLRECREWIAARVEEKKGEPMKR